MCSSTEEQHRTPPARLRLVLWYAATLLVATSVGATCSTAGDGRGDATDVSSADLPGDGATVEVDAGFLDGPGPRDTADGSDALSSDPDIAIDTAPPTACGACHGTLEQPAPPPAIDGSTDPAHPGVGSHLAHMTESTWHAAIRCRHCHPEPDTADAPGHQDDERPADVVFWGLATALVEPSYVGGSCNVYCHGAAMRVDPRTSPLWTSTQMTCGSCHDRPPAYPHPAAEDCGRCHLEVSDALGNIVNPAYHIDSIVMAPKHAHLVHLGGAGGEDHPCDTCHDGAMFHGRLNDGQPLETTTVCDDCHGVGVRDPLQWREYPGLVRQP